MRKGKFGKEVISYFVQIGGNLDLRGAQKLPSLNLTGAHIENELHLAGSGSEAPTWREDAHLVLRNVTVDALQETQDAWPRHLELDGFVYRWLGGLGGSTDVTVRGSRWYVDWLAKDDPYSPQPYEQLAAVLQRMGHGEEANDILYAGRERARGIAFKEGKYWAWTGQTALKLIIGYGYGSRYFRSIYWILGLIIIGKFFLDLSGQHRVETQNYNQPIKIGLFYSLDMLLPIIKLRQRHYEIDLNGFVRYYFYFHQIMGYVLASFLIAGLSGLTR